MGQSSSAHVWVGVETKLTNLDTFDINESIEDLILESGTDLCIESPVISGEEREDLFVGVNIITVYFDYKEIDLTFVQEQLNKLRPLLAILFDVKADDVKVYMNSSYF